MNLIKNKTLKEVVFTGLRYNSTAKILDVVFAVSYGVLMARMLGPSVFGILAMASIFTGISAILIDFGTGDAIIRHDEDKTSHKFLSSIFWLNTLIGIFISIIFILLSGFIAKFFGHEIIKIIIIIYSINIVFSAMSNVPRSIIRKKMDFKSILLQRAIILPISGIVGVWMALNGYGIWSIVVQQIIVTTVGSFLYLYFSKWFPRLIIKRSHIMEIFHFSSYLSASKFLNYFTKKGDVFLIGKFIGDYQLGIYSKGYQLTVKMLKVINGIIIGVLYPSISKVKDNKEKLKTSFLDISQIMFSIYGFIVLLGFLFSKQAVNVILGEKWVALSALIPIFLLLALFFALGSIVSHYLKVLGYSKLIFKIIIFTSSLTVISFIVGLNWGSIGVAIGYLSSTVVLLFILIYHCSKLLDIKISTYISLFIKDLIILLFIGLFIKIIVLNLNVSSSFYLLLIGVTLSIVGLLFLHYLFRTYIYQLITNIMK